MKNRPGPSRRKKPKKRSPMIKAWRLPEGYKPKGIEAEFRDRADAIWLGYHERKARERAGGKANSAPFDTADGFLKRQAYGLFYATFAEKKSAEMIKRIVNKYACSPESPTFGENRYHWALIAMFTIDGVIEEKEENPDQKKKSKITAAKKKIWRWAKEMEYARRNHVKARDLIGFLYQSGCSKNISTLLERKDEDPSIKCTPEWENSD